MYPHERDRLTQPVPTQLSYNFPRNARNTHRSHRSTRKWGIQHPNVTTGQAYAVGFSGQIDEHEFGGDTLPLEFSNIVDETDSDITAAASSQRTQNEIIQFPEGLYKHRSTLQYKCGKYGRECGIINTTMYCHRKTGPLSNIRL